MFFAAAIVHLQDVVVMIEVDGGSNLTLYLYMVCLGCLFVCGQNWILGALP